jgi:hypothetical protein
MQSGPINPGQVKSLIKRKSADTAEAVDASKAASPTSEGKLPENAAEVKEAAPQAEPKETYVDVKGNVDVGFVVDTPAEALRYSLDKDGNPDFEMTLAYVKKSDKERLAKEGAIFPETKNAIMGDGVGPEGSIETIPLYDTNNPETVNVARAHEVDKKLLETDPETGQARLENYTPTLLAQGEGILGADFTAVPKGSVVIPEGYTATLGLSKEAQKVKSHRALANNITKTLGTFSGSSLAGIMKLPVVTPLAPILALGSVGFAVNQNLEAKQDAKAQLGYLDQQVKKSTSDLVEMQTPDGQSFKVSAKNERFRLETAVRQANLQLASSGLLAAAGGSAIVGGMATAGVAGFAGMAGAAAAAPFLAGGSMVLGSGTMVFNSLAQLKELSKEKVELEAAAAKGETHVDRVLEGMNPNLRRATSATDEMVAIPISERLKQVEKEQRKQRLLATAMSGGMVSIGNMVLGIGAATAVGAAAMAPAGALLAGQSIGQLRELGKEKRELLDAQAKGETMVERDLQQSDLSWKKERVPISTLLAENQKARNKHKMILTSVGSAGAALGMTLGAGMSIAAAAPLALIPLAIGALLFPDKVKEFASKVKGLISGLVGDAGKTKRKARDATEKAADSFAARMDEKLAGLKESNPGLFTERPSKMGRLFPNPLNALRTEYGGYYHEMGRLVKDYASADSAQERQQYMKHIGDAIKNAPDEARPGLAAFQEEFAKASMEVEAQWLARDIALEMKTPVADKVVNDKRVKARVSELAYPTDNLTEMYKESLEIESSQSRLSQLALQAQQPNAASNPLLEPMIAATQSELQGLVDSKTGGNERDTMRLMARTEVFKAARFLAMKERDLGVDLYTRYVDALQRPEDQENLELLMKEVGYRQQVGVSGDEVEMVSGALRTLTTPLQLAPEQPDEHVAKLQAAIGEMKQADPKLANQMLEADAKISNPDTFKGMTAQEALAERTKLNAIFQTARRGIKEKTPEALNAWESADGKLKALAANPQQAAQASAPVALQGAEARMENAFLGLTKKQPELAEQLGDAFALLNSPAAYQGIDASQVQQAKIGANLKLNQVRKKLEKKEPELMKLWDGARKEVEKTYFERTIDHDFKARVLDHASVKEASEQLGVSAEEVEGLYMGLMKSQILHDPRDLEANMADESGEAVDTKKAEMLNVIDKAMLRTAAEVTNGGADFVAPSEVPQNPANDPNVKAWLEQSPAVVRALNSEGFAQLAANMQLPTEEVKQAYLTLAQADLNPALAAEFNGRLEAGEMQTVKTYQVGQAALRFIMESVKPDPAAVAQGVEQSMGGTVIQTVLGDPGIQELAKSLGVDPNQAMKLYLQAEIGKDPSVLADLEVRAKKGETAAQAQLQFLQQAIPAVQYVANQVQSGAIPVPDANPEAA